jgi:hypothetical protein
MLKQNPGLPLSRHSYPSSQASLMPGIPREGVECFCRSLANLLSPDVEARTDKTSSPGTPLDRRRSRLPVGESVFTNGPRMKGVMFLDTVVAPSPFLRVRGVGLQAQQPGNRARVFPGVHPPRVTRFAPRRWPFRCRTTASVMEMSDQLREDHIRTDYFVFPEIGAGNESIGCKPLEHLYRVSLVSPSVHVHRRNGAEGPLPGSIKRQSC